MVEYIGFNAVEPRPRNFEIFRFNGKGKIFCLYQTIIAAFQLRLQHFRVFLTNTVKTVPLWGNGNVLLKVLFVGMVAD